jgi:Tfp pilus assembly protein FimT
MAAPAMHCCWRGAADVRSVSLVQEQLLRSVVDVLAALALSRAAAVLSSLPMLLPAQSASSWPRLHIAAWQGLAAAAADAAEKSEPMDVSQGVHQHHLLQLSISPHADPLASVHVAQAANSCAASLLHAGVTCVYHECDAPICGPRCCIMCTVTASACQ